MFASLAGEEDLEPSRSWPLLLVGQVMHLGVESADQYFGLSFFDQETRNNIAYYDESNTSAHRKLHYGLETLNFRIDANKLEQWKF